MARRKRKKNTRRKKGGKIMSSIEEQQSTKIDCTKNNIDKEEKCYLDPISLECLDDDNVIKVNTADQTCFDKTQFCKYASGQVNRNLPINNPITNSVLDINWVKNLGCQEPNLQQGVINLSRFLTQRRRQQDNIQRRRAQQQQQDVIMRRHAHARQLIRNNGSYQVQGPDFWQGDMTMESWETKPCCSKCEPFGCMSYLGCGENKCTPCDSNLQPGRGQRRCVPGGRRGGKRKSRKKKLRKTKRKSRKKKRKRKTKRKRN